MIFYLSLTSVSSSQPSTRMFNNLLLLIKHIILQRKPQTSKNFSLRPQFLPSTWSNSPLFSVWQVLNCWNFSLSVGKLKIFRKFSQNFHSERRRCRLSLKPVNILHSIYFGNFVWKLNFTWCCLTVSSTLYHDWRQNFHRHGCRTSYSMRCCRPESSLSCRQQFDVISFRWSAFLLVSSQRERISWLIFFL